ncbi:unnamed protein product [Ixodes pacificus]
MAVSTEPRRTEGDEVVENNEEDQKTPVVPYKRQIVWRNVFVFIYLHAASLYGIYLAIFYAKWGSILLALGGLPMSGLGSSAGAHRLWCHRAYKAKLPLRIFLMLCNCLSLQNDLYVWTRDHRLHHKYSDTDADPHNINRGFFFAHVGWLLCKKHPEVMRKGKTIDCSDVLQDPVVAFQRKYYVPMVALFCFAIPIYMPMAFFGESFWNAMFINGILRYVISLHMTWLVNSAAHTWGYRPYDRHIRPTDNPALAMAMFGEGFHNYHHTFPSDYATSEYGDILNPATTFIHMMAKIGQAYDLKSPSRDALTKRVLRTGDPSQSYFKVFSNRV